jgi:hypothetical protein
MTEEKAITFASLLGARMWKWGLDGGHHAMSLPKDSEAHLTWGDVSSDTWVGAFKMLCHRNGLDLPR